MEFIKDISFVPHNFKLPVGDRELEDTLLSSYILKLGVSIFGENRVGIRLLFILFGTGSLFFIFKLVEEFLGIKVALLTLCLLAFSHYHIGISRIAAGEAILFFFVTASLYTFFQALNTKIDAYVYWTAVLGGVGCLAYQWMLALLVVYVLYLVVAKKHQFWLKKKVFYYAVFVVFIIVSPYLIWSYSDGFTKVYTERVFDFGISLRAFYLYLGEVFAWLTEHTEFFIWGDNVSEGSLVLIDGSWHLRVDGSNEIPFVHWVLGLLIPIGFGYCLIKKDKAELISFCLIMFMFVFIATSIVAGSYSWFDDHGWAGMTLFPGVILCAYMLVSLGEKFHFINLAIFGLIIYLFVKSLNYVSLPESQFAVPPKELHNYYLDRAEHYLQMNKRDLAVDRCYWVLGRTRDVVIIKRSREILKKINETH